MKTDIIPPPSQPMPTHHSYVDQYRAISNEITGQLKLILSAKPIKFYEQGQDSDLDTLMDLPGFSYSDKYGNSRYYHIMDLNLAQDGSISGTGKEIDDFYTMTFEESNLSLYSLCCLIDLIHQGKFLNA